MGEMIVDTPVPDVIPSYGVYFAMGLTPLRFGC